MSTLVKHLEDVTRPGLRVAPTSCMGIETAGESVNVEQAAYERGVADALMRSGATLEQALSAAEQNAASLRAQWSAECQERVCREAAAGRSLIEERLSEELARALSTFVEAKQRQRIRESFLEKLREILTMNCQIPIKLVGPADERKLMVDCLGEMGITAMYHDCDADVIEAEIGLQIVRADFASWSRRWIEEFGDDLDVRR